MAKSVKCPRFGCNGVGMPVDTKKKFSLGKAIAGDIVGGVLFGPIGAAVAGAAAGVNGKNGKTKFVCNKCGKVFEKQL